MEGVVEIPLVCHTRTQLFLAFSVEEEVGVVRCVVPAVEVEEVGEYYGCGPLRGKLGLHVPFRNA